MLLSVFQTRPPVYILTQYTLFHSTDFSSFRVLNPFCTRVELNIEYNRPTLGRLYYVVAAVPLRVYEFRRGRRTNLEKGLEVFCWYCIPTRAAGSVLRLTSVIGNKTRVPLGFQQSWFTKRGTQSFEGSSRRSGSQG